MNHFIKIVLFLFLISCNINKNFNELDITYFNYDKDFLTKFQKIIHISPLLDYTKDIILVKTKLFYITNRYVFPFFYFEFEDLFKELNNDNFELSKKEIKDYFLFVAKVRALNHLMYIEAKKNGFDASNDEVYNRILTISDNNVEDFKNRIKETMFTYEFFEKDNREIIIIEKYKNGKILKNIDPTEEELIIYYEQNPSLSLIRERVFARHILLLTNNLTESEKKKKYELISSIKKMAEKGEDFSELAKIYSEDETTKKSGGKIGEYLERGQTFKEFEEAAFNTKEGGISDIIETEYGFHIIKVDKIEKERKLTFEEVRDKIYNLVKLEKKNEAIENENIRLIKKYNLRVIFR